MGDRISVSFRKFGRESVAVFSHWEGEHLLEKVREFLKWLDDQDISEAWPLGRKDPETVVFHFCAWLVKQEEELPKGDYYLGRDESDGDNSDNGHYVVDLGAYDREDMEFIEKVE